MSCVCVMCSERERETGELWPASCINPESALSGWGVDPWHGSSTESRCGLHVRVRVCSTALLWVWPTFWRWPAARRLAWFIDTQTHFSGISFWSVCVRERVSLFGQRWRRLVSELGPVQAYTKLLWHLKLDRRFYWSHALCWTHTVF